MHEAGIARAIAETLRGEGFVGVPVRVLVTGGHDEPAAFDVSLMFHLGLAAPEMDLSMVRIVHLPSERWCPTCGHRFDAVGESDCPACGGATMGSRLDESIEIERVDGPGPSDPAQGAGGPSARELGAAQAGDMDPFDVPSHDLVARRDDPGHGDPGRGQGHVRRGRVDRGPERPDDRVT